MKNLVKRRIVMKRLMTTVSRKMVTTVMRRSRMRMIAMVMRKKRTVRLKAMTQT